MTSRSLSTPSRQLVAVVALSTAACAADRVTVPTASAAPSPRLTALVAAADACVVGENVPGQATVATASELQARLAAARPGDEIVLRDGVTFAQSDGFTIGVDGTAELPIVIRAQSLLGATVGTGFAVHGNHVVLAGLAFNGQGTALLDGDSSQVTRNRFTDTEGEIALRVTGGYAPRADYNEISGVRGRGLGVSPLNSDNVHGGTASPTIARNYLHDWFGTGINVREGMQLGQTDTHTDIDLRATAEYNLFDGVGIEQETISVKSSSNVIRFNTLLNSRRITNRHGEDNLYLANWIEDSDGLNVHDQNNKVYANRCVNCAASMGFMVMRGGTDPSSSVTSPAPWARNTELVGNIGRIRAAHSTNPVLPEGTRVAAGQDVVAGNGGTWTTFTYTGPALPAAVKLTPADVGPNAGTCAPPIQHVDIDVQPAQLSLASSAVVNVIVRSRAGFDAVALNAGQARLAIGGGPGVAPIMRGTTVNSSTADFDGDGRLDRLIGFRMSDLVAAGLTATNRDFVLRTGAIPSPIVGRDAAAPTVVP